MLVVVDHGLELTTPQEFTHLCRPPFSGRVGVFGLDLHEQTVAHPWLPGFQQVAPPGLAFVTEPENELARLARVRSAHNDRSRPEIRNSGAHPLYCRCIHHNAVLVRPSRAVHLHFLIR